MVPDIHSYGLVMDVCANGGMADKVIELHQALLAANLKPSRLSLNALLKAYRKLGRWQNIVDVMRAWPKSLGSSPYMTSYNIAIGKALTISDHRG